jgi:predicted HTH domain antitoxin
MKERPQVNIRLDKELLDEIDELASAERIDRSEITRRLLNSGVSAYRMELAIRDYRQGNVSAWRAASMAGVSLYEMLDRIHAEGIPYQLDPEVLERLDTPVVESHWNARATAVRDRTTTYGHVETDTESGLASLREEFRPAQVKTLFVGESSPAGGTHFYRANSNLFRATRAAFAEAFGDDRVPHGPRFLHWFREQGCWLVDLADRPINQLAGGERDAVVSGGIGRLADLIRETRPESVVVVKASIATAVRQAVELADSRAVVVELPFPVRQWRQVFIRDLAKALIGG